MRAGIYARISRDEAGEELGVGRQIEDCRSLLQRGGHVLVDTYSDNNLSAYSGVVRPQYRRLVADVESGRIEHVVAWAPDRLLRQPRELEDFIDLVERTKATVETVKAGAYDLSTPHGRTVARIFGAVSRGESEKTGERVSRAHQQAKEQGKWRGPIPYGLRKSATPGLPEVHPDESVIVRHIIDRLNRGDALTRIAADLNRDGLKPRRGVEWTHTGVLRLIQSPAIGGLVKVGDELHPAAFAGVVTEVEWRSALAGLARRPRGERRRPREKLSLLGGILRCDEHGHKCIGGSASHAAVYVAGMPGQCFVSITRAAADAMVTETLMKRLRRDDAAMLLQPSRDVDVAALQAERELLRLRQAGLTDLVASGATTPGAARPGLESLRDQIAAIDAQMTAGPMIIEPGIDPEPQWELLTMPQRREVVGILCQSVTLKHTNGRSGPVADPTRVVITWPTT